MRLPGADRGGPAVGRRRTHVWTAAVLMCAAEPGRNQGGPPQHTHTVAVYLKHTMSFSWLTCLLLLGTLCAGELLLPSYSSFVAVAAACSFENFFRATNFNKCPSLRVLCTRLCVCVLVVLFVVHRDVRGCFSTCTSTLTGSVFILATSPVCSWSCVCYHPPRCHSGQCCFSCDT